MLRPANVPTGTLTLTVQQGSISFTEATLIAPPRSRWFLKEKFPAGAGVVFEKLPGKTATSAFGYTWTGPRQDPESAHSFGLPQVREPGVANAVWKRTRMHPVSSGFGKASRTTTSADQAASRALLGRESRARLL